MSKLAIERRVQYGAEKMLDVSPLNSGVLQGETHGDGTVQVIEQRAGGGETSEQEQVKERIFAQLEAANQHIKLLEARLERLRGG